MKCKILILEDNVTIASHYAKLLGNNDFAVKFELNSRSFFRQYETFYPDVIILDIKLNNSELDGIEVYEKLLRSYKSKSKVIVLSGAATRSEVAHAMQLGAHTFIEKKGDFNVEKLIADIQTACQLKKQEDLSKELFKEKQLLTQTFLTQNPFIGDSPKIKQLKKEIKNFAQAGVDVMVIGDTGTGKEVVADHLYWSSKRAGKPYIKVNSGGIPESLTNTELFGHKRGAFTDAKYNKKGYFEKADHGYLFLDEIANISLDLQAKILRAIENKEIRVVGGDLKKVDLKLIFSTNEELEKLVHEKVFRKDLYYRIAKNLIKLPRLVERGNDITLLFNYFCTKHRKEYQAYLKLDQRRIKQVLLSYHWPGNVRELSSFCENLLIRYNIIDNDVLISEIEKKCSGTFQKEDSSLFKLLQIKKIKNATNNFEREYLQYHLSLNNGHIGKTAEKVGIERTTLYRKLKKFEENKEKSKPGKSLNKLSIY